MLRLSALRASKGIRQTSFPTRSVDLGSIRNHTVEIKKYGSVLFALYHARDHGQLY
jgi:hypothetical protein